jgi:preprotein translocase subunit SecD
MFRTSLAFVAFFSLISQVIAENDSPPLLQLVAFKGGTLNLESQNITNVDVQPNLRSEEYSIHISFDDQYREAFRKLSIANLGYQVIILICGEEVSRPVILEPIIGGDILVDLVTEEKANEAADMLSGLRSCGH